MPSRTDIADAVAREARHVIREELDRRCVDRLEEQEREDLAATLEAVVYSRVNGLLMKTAAEKYDHDYA